MSSVRMNESAREWLGKGRVRNGELSTGHIICMPTCVRETSRRQWIYETGRIGKSKARDTHWRVSLLVTGLDGALVNSIIKQ